MNDWEHINRPWKPPSMPADLESVSSARPFGIGGWCLEAYSKCALKTPTFPHSGLVDPHLGEN